MTSDPVSAADQPRGVPVAESTAVVTASSRGAGSGEPESVTGGTLRPVEPGTVVLVGGGPGDPGLVTWAGLRAVQQADVVLVDHLAPTEILEQAPAGCEIVGVGKHPRAEYVPQERINELCIEHARAGKRVVRFKGGDPFVFGRGGEEALACAEAGVPVRVIPGVTSGVAGPALAGIPVTHRGFVQGFTMVSGHVPPGDPRSTVNWAALAAAETTLVVLMGVANRALIAAALVENGLAATTPVAVVERAGTPTMRVTRATLTELSAGTVECEPPALLVIGAVARLDLSVVSGFGLSSLV